MNELTSELDGATDRFVREQIKNLSGNLCKSWPPIAGASEEESLEQVCRLLTECCFDFVSSIVEHDLTDLHKAHVESKIRELAPEPFQAWKQFALSGGTPSLVEGSSASSSGAPSPPPRMQGISKRGTNQPGTGRKKKC